MDNSKRKTNMTSDYNDLNKQRHANFLSTDRPTPFAKNEVASWALIWHPSVGSSTRKKSQTEIFQKR